MLTKFNKFNFFLLLISFSLFLAGCAVPIVDGTTRTDFNPSASSDVPLSVTFIDVGQGDSVLIKTEHMAMVIDGGVSSAYNKILETLEHEDVTHLNYLVATHPHADHIGGLIPLVSEENGITIDEVIMPNLPHTSQTFENFVDALLESNITVSEPIVGDIFEMDNAIFTVLAPYDTDGNNLNDYSVALMLDYGNYSFILTGDAEKNSELQMIDNFDDISADVLFVGHHGSKTSTVLDFLEAVNPSYAVISAGINNRYNHPDKEIVDRLLSFGAEVLGTYDYGSITFFSDGEELWFTTEK